MNRRPAPAPGAQQHQLIESIVEQITAKLDQRLAGVERQIHGVAADLDSVAKQAAYLLARAGVRVPSDADDADDGEIKQVDQTWQCRKCGSRLGFYDQDQDVLRIRHKDLTVWIQVGLGGVVSVPCRSCSELNTVRNDDPAEPA